MAKWSGLFKRRSTNSIQTSYRRTHLSDMAAALRGWSFACMDRRASTIAKVDYEIYLSDAYGREVIAPKGHWAQRIMDNPNPFMERWWVQYLPSMWRDLQGNAFIYTPCVEVDGKEIPHSMWVLPSNMVQVIVDPSSTKLLGYTYRTESGVMPIPARHMIHLKHMRPSDGMAKNFFVGSSLVETCIDEIQTRYEISGYLRKFFENDAIPPLVLTTTGTMDEKSWKTMQARWNERFPQHRIVGLLENGTSIQPVTRDGLGTVDKKDTQGITSEAVDIICAVFGLNKGLLTGDYSERSTAEVQQDLFMSHTVDGILAYVDEAFTKWMRGFDERLVFRHKRESYVDPSEKRANEMHDFSLGLINRNDLRKERGLDPVPDGDKYFVNGMEVSAGTVDAQPALGVGGGNVVLPSAGDAPDPTATTATGTAPEAKKKELTDSSDNGDDEPDATPESFYNPSFSAVWKRKDQAVAPSAALIERTVRLVFDDLMGEVVGALKSSKGKAMRTALKADIDANVPLFNVNVWVRKLQNASQGDIADLVAKMMKEATEEVGQNWDEISSTFDTEARLSLETSLNKIGKTINTIDDELQGLLKANYDKTPDELTALIESRFENVYTKSRAQAIGRTTSTFATNDAQRRTWKKLGFKRQWLSQRDGDVRIAHRNADGQIEDEGGYFTVNGERTLQPCGDGLSARNAVNCRCYTAVVMEA